MVRMDELLNGLRACAEPTRLRIMALVARGMFCVMEFTEILGQSQPRLSRHLRLLGEAGLLDRTREGANVWFALPDADTQAGSLARAILARLPEEDPVLAADRRQAARVLAERARIATESFQKRGADWDEMNALDLPADRVEAALQSVLPAQMGRLLDIGTGTGRLLEVLAPRISAGVGVDASRAMLALARARLSKPGMDHCLVRLADMYRLPLPDASFDHVMLQMVLHYAEDPEAALREAVRVLKPGGMLVVIDLAPHANAHAMQDLAHRWPGFPDAAIASMLGDTVSTPDAITVPGPLDVRLWTARRPVLPSAFAATKEIA
jgi:ArsR family transcriptional regulator